MGARILIRCALAIVGALVVPAHADGRVVGEVTVVEATGKQYKLQGPDGDRNGSFSISAGRLHNGWNKVRLTVRSNSGKTRDDVSIWVQVAR